MLQKVAPEPPTAFLPPSQPGTDDADETNETNETNEVPIIKPGKEVGLKVTPAPPATFPPPSPPDTCDPDETNDTNETNEVYDDKPRKKVSSVRNFHRAATVRVKKHTPTSVHRIASRKMWPKRFELPHFDEEYECRCVGDALQHSTPHIILLVIFACYWGTYYGLTMALCPHVSYFIFMIPLVLCGMCCVFPCMGVLGNLNFFSFFAFGLAWMSLVPATVMTCSALDLGEQTVKEDVSVAQRYNFGEDAFFFTDGYLAAHMQQSNVGRHCHQSQQKNKGEVCLDYTGYVAPVFVSRCRVPKCRGLNASVACDASECDNPEHLVSLIVMKEPAPTSAPEPATPFVPSDGLNCPNSKSGGLCVYKYNSAYGIDFRSQLQTSCRQMLAMYDPPLAPSSVCDHWPYAVLGDVQQVAADDLDLGKHSFKVAGGLLLISCIASMLCRDHD